VAVSAGEHESLTWQEWLDFEDGHEQRHELFRGQAVLLQGGTERHDLTVTAMYDRLAGPFRERRCAIFPHNRKVVTPTGDGYYPDLLIRCGPRSDERYELAPTWVFEVLSPTNTRAEMAVKLRGYTSIDSLEGYVVVDPDTRLVQAYVRHAGVWQFLDVTDSTLPVGPVLVDFAEVLSAVDELEAFG
jgi:Uma2 family endonuclease